MLCVGQVSCHWLIFHCQKRVLTVVLRSFGHQVLLKTLRSTKNGAKFQKKFCMR